MRYGIIYPPRASMRSGYYPDENKTLYQCVEEVRKTNPDYDNTDEETIFRDSFFIEGFARFIQTIGAGMTGYTENEYSDFMLKFLPPVAESIYADNADRFVAIVDVKRYARHVKAWGLQNAQKWFAKWQATKTILQPAGEIGGLETITETTTKTGNNTSKSSHDITKKDSEQNNGTNSTTANLSNSKTDKEESNDFPVYASGAASGYASGTRKLESTGTSEGTTTGTANGTRVLDSTDKGTNDRADTINESEKRTYEHSNSYTKDDTATLQELYANKVQNLSKEIADSYGQFFNGDLLAYQL